MGQINRLRDAEIANGNIIDASDIDAELDQLVNESNSQDTRLAGVESGNVTLTGVKTFSNAPKLDALEEKSVDSGVSVDGVVLKDAMILAASDSPVLSEGFLAYDNIAKFYKGHNGTSEITFLTSSGDLPTGYIRGSHITYSSASQILISAGLRCRDDSDAVNIVFSSNEIIDITASTGAANTNCLMNGLLESASTWYYLWAIAKVDGSDAKGLLTTSSSAIASFPTDYTVKRLIGVVRNDSSSDFIPFTAKGPWEAPEYLYNVVFPESGAVSVGPTNILDNGIATSFTAVSAASFIPPISKLGVFKLASLNGGTYTTGIRPTGETHNGWSQKANNFPEMVIEMATDASQSIDYKVGNTSGPMDLYVVGFTITEFNS